MNKGKIMILSSCNQFPGMTPKNQERRKDFRSKVNSSQISSRNASRLTANGLGTGLSACISAPAVVAVKNIADAGLSACVSHPAIVAAVASGICLHSFGMWARNIPDFISCPSSTWDPRGLTMSKANREKYIENFYAQRKVYGTIAKISGAIFVGAAVGATLKGAMTLLP